MAFSVLTFPQKLWFLLVKELTWHQRIVWHLVLFHVFEYTVISYLFNYFLAKRFPQKTGEFMNRCFEILFKNQNSNKKVKLDMPLPFINNNVIMATNNNLPVSFLHKRCTKSVPGLWHVSILLHGQTRTQTLLYRRIVSLLKRH